LSRPNRRPRLPGAVPLRPCRGRQQDRHSPPDFGGSRAHPWWFRASEARRHPGLQ